MANEKNLKALEEAMKAAGAKYIQAVNDRVSLKKQKELKTAVSNAQDDYNAAVAEDTYCNWAKEGDPIRTAARMRTYRGKRVSFKVTDANLTYMEIKDADLLVNLVDMESAIGIEHFADPKWFDMTSNLAFIIASAVGSSLGCDDLTYEVEEAAKEFKFAGDVDLKDESTCIAALQQVFDAILYIPDEEHKANLLRADGPAWSCIKYCMTRQGSGFGKVMIGNTGKMSELVLNALHIAITNGRYSAEADKADK